MKSLKKGFTLVELMVVIVIIGILAALAIPRFLGAASKTKASEFRPVLKQMYTLQEAYRQEKDLYGKLTEIGFENPSTAARFAYTEPTAGTAPALPAAGKTANIGIATPAGDGLKIKLPAGGTLAATDIGCVNDQGNQFAYKGATGLVTIASVTAAASDAECK